MLARLLRRFLRFQLGVGAFLGWSKNAVQHHSQREQVLDGAQVTLFY